MILVCELVLEKSLFACVHTQTHTNSTTCTLVHGPAMLLLLNGSSYGMYAYVTGSAKPSMFACKFGLVFRILKSHNSTVLCYVIEICILVAK